MATTTFTGVFSVAIPVSDQDRTKALLEQLGLETKLDQELQPGFRWLEMRPPGGQTTLSFVRATDQRPAGIDTGIRLATEDARAAHKLVQELGLEAGELLDWETAPLMFSFADPDGNLFYVMQATVGE